MRAGIGRELDKRRPKEICWIADESKKMLMPMRFDALSDDGKPARVESRRASRNDDDEERKK
jgi:hypothetical protein